MATCEVCGNEYDKSFELTAAGARHVFDSFECAIQAMAPICGHCKKGHWARSRSRRTILLLRALRTIGDLRRCARSGGVGADCLFAEPPSGPDQNATTASEPSWLVN
jgi:hypothetical protein